MTAEIELGVDPFLEGRLVRLVEAFDLPPGEFLVGEVCKRRSAAERARFGEQLRGPGGIARGELLAPAGDEVVEAIDVDPTRLDREQVAAPAGDDRLGAELLA